MKNAILLLFLSSAPAVYAEAPPVGQAESVETKIYRITEARRAGEPVTRAERAWAVAYLLAAWERLTAEKRDKELYGQAARKIVYMNRELGRKARGLEGPRYWTARQLAVRLESQYGKTYGLWLLREDRVAHTRENIDAYYEGVRAKILDKTYKDLKLFGVQP